MFYRFKFLQITSLTLIYLIPMVISLTNSQLAIASVEKTKQNYQKNNSNSLGIKGNKQLSIDNQPEQNRTFDESTPIPEGYQRKTFSDEGSSLFSNYRLDFGDGITVNVERFPEFNFIATLDGEGNIFVPLLGRISVRGMTLEEVETKISYELGQRFLQQKPQVAAFLSAQRPITLTVMGEVFKPGYYSIGQGTPMSTILGLAGGSTDNADLRSIIIKRTLIDGTVIEEKLDLYTPLIAGGKEPTIRLQAGDAVIISKLEIGKEQNYDRVFVSRTSLPQQTITVRVVSPIQPAGSALRNIVLPSGSTFLDAVAQLPEFVTLLYKNDVTLMRFDAESSKVVTQSLNVVETVQTGDINQNIPLRNNDVIIVSRTLLGRVLAAIRVLTQPIRDVFGFTDFIFNNNN